jgi:dTDP-glucose pyrophosphorylase
MSHNWKNALLDESASIKQALQVIDQEALRVALIVNKKRELKGIVTDGDIRRGLIAGVNLVDKVSEILNQSPFTAEANTEVTVLSEYMKKRDILFIPLMEGKKLVGLHTLNQALNYSIKENPVFIMAGGFGTRLSPLTDECPKPMLRIGDKPMLEIVISRLIKYGYRNFFISTHYLPEVITSYFGDGKNWDVDITYIHEETPLGTGGALGLLSSSCQDKSLILINGDILTKVNFDKLLSFHSKNNADLTMCVRDYQYQVPFGVVEGDGDIISSIIEKPTQRFFVNAGIYVLSPYVIGSIRKNSYLDMPSLVEQQISLNNKVFKFPVHEYWLDIGRMDDFRRAQADIKLFELD